MLFAEAARVISATSVYSLVLKAVAEAKNTVPKWLAFREQTIQFYNYVPKMQLGKLISIRCLVQGYPAGKTRF